MKKINRLYQKKYKTNITNDKKNNNKKNVEQIRKKKQHCQSVVQIPKKKEKTEKFLKSEKKDKKEKENFCKDLYKEILDNYKIKNNSKPILSKNSNFIALKKKNGNSEVLKRMKYHEKKSKQKNLKLKKKAESDFNLKFTFTPKINDFSNKLEISKTTKNSKRNETLYKKIFQIKKKEKLNETTQRFSFKPEINRKSVNLARNSNFFQRTQKFISQKKLNIKKLEEIQKIDPKTKQKLFNPIINQKKKNGNLTKKNIFKNLSTNYKKKNDLPKKKDFCFQMPENKKNNKIVEKMMIEKLNEIFCDIDSENKNYIIKKDIDNFKIDLKVKNMLNPVLEEIEENEKISRDQFIDACLNFFENYYIPSKCTTLLRYRKKNDFKENFDFQPKILKKSKKIAEGKFKYNEPIYKRLSMIDTKTITDIKKKSWVLKEEMELGECTFEPNIEKEIQIKQILSNND